MRAILLASVILCIAPAQVHASSPVITRCSAATPALVSDYEPVENGRFNVYVDGRDVSVPPDRVIYDRNRAAGIGILLWFPEKNGDASVCGFIVGRGK